MRSFPPLLDSGRIEAALIAAVELDGKWYVPADDVPDHWTVAGRQSHGHVQLNRVGLDARRKHLERIR